MTKAWYSIFLGFIVCTAGAVVKSQGDLVIDKLEATVSNATRTDVIVASDIKRRSFDGTEHTLDDMILEAVKDQRGEDLGITIEKEDVDRYLRAMSRGEDVSPEAIVARAKTFGYANAEEFYYDLKRLYRSNSAMEMEIRSLLSVSEQEARAYYEAHPESQEGTYFLQTAFMPVQNGSSIAQLKKSLDDSATVDAIDWSTPFGITYSELAQERDFIRTMDIGQIHAVVTDVGLQLYRLKNHNKPRQLSFEERRKAIINTLRDSKFKEAFDRYNRDVMQDVTVIRY
jgi:hypothetical protein